MNLIQPRGCRNCFSRTLFNGNLVCTLNPPTCIGLVVPGPSGQMQLQWASQYTPINDELPPCSHWRSRVGMPANDAKTDEISFRPPVREE